MRKSSSSIMNISKLITKRQTIITSSNKELPMLTNNNNNNITTYFRSPFLLSTKQVYHFSSDNNKHQQSNSNNDKLTNKKEEYTAKHKEMEDNEEFTQDAEMTPEGEKDENKDTPFIPTAFGNYVIGISAACLILAYAVMEVQFMRASNSKKSPAEGAKKVVAKGKAHIGGEWELIGTDGKPVSYKDFAGKYYLIYFGFCNCPDICPNSLMKLAKALEKVRKSPEAKFFDIESVFVSVDPDRDSPEKIEKFAKYFDKTMIGVTGKSNDDPALKDCMKKFKIYSSKIEFEDEESVIKGRKSYTIDHTILTYLMNPQNEYAAHIGANLGEHDMAKLIMEKINEDQRKIMQKMKV